jgi:hypothetical protein
MNRPDWLTRRSVAALPKNLSDLAYECESLAIRDPLLPPSLTRALVDIATALRDEADRRGKD